MKKGTTNILMLAAGLLAAGFVSCRSGQPEPHPEQMQLPVLNGEVMAMPKAIVYQVSGDNCMDLVPITLSADGKKVVSYPAPSDLNEGQTPIDLGDGWWLDRRGIGPTSVFTTYTYEEYAAMKTPPTIEQLLKHIDRKAHITRMIELPITAAYAAQDPAVARTYTEGNFEDCVELLNRK